MLDVLLAERIGLNRVYKQGVFTLFTFLGQLKTPPVTAGN